MKVTDWTKATHTEVLEPRFVPAGSGAKAHRIPCPHGSQMALPNFPFPSETRCSVAGLGQVHRTDGFEQTQQPKCPILASWASLSRQWSPPGSTWGKNNDQLETSSHRVMKRRTFKFGQGLEMSCLVAI